MQAFSEATAIEEVRRVDALAVKLLADRPDLSFSEAWLIALESNLPARQDGAGEPKGCRAASPLASILESDVDALPLFAKLDSTGTIRV